MSADEAGRTVPTTLRLSRERPSVSLTGQGAAYGTLRVNLAWQAEPKPRGIVERVLKPLPVHLDLGCLYEYADGSKGVVQALGDSFDDLHTYGDQPICWLDGDSRSGAASGGENLFVDLAYLTAIRRLLVFAFSCEGPPDWGRVGATVTVFPAQGPDLEVALDEPDEASPLVAVLMLDNTGPQLSVRREVRYVRGGQQMLDELYGWGMQWRPTRT